MSQKLTKYFFKLVLLISIFSQSLNAQILDPVHWDYSSKSINDSIYELHIEATIDKGFHLYSQKINKNGPIPTSFKFTFFPNNNIQLLGAAQDPEGEEVFDENFQMNLTYFSKKAVFVQKIKVPSSERLDSIRVSARYMACDDTQCTPPLKRSGTIHINKNGNGSKSGDVTFWTIFWLSFLGGLLALVTPCVFPMIPLTISFFLKRGGSRRKALKEAFLFAIFIILIYIGLGTIVSIIFGAAALNQLSTNVYLNFVFFLLLVVFGLSFLGAFEIRLPNSWVNKLDNKSEKGGVLGIFFVALTLAIVSFSCTSPIVGTILVQSSYQNLLGPMIGMTGFSLALAIPFCIFAIFPSWLNTLPKSGSWMISFKVFLGFLELALAFKFLSNVDLVLQLHWLEREIFIAIWVAIFFALSLFLLKLITLYPEKDNTVHPYRLFVGLLSLAFTLYLVTGLWGAPLKLISGFPPPLHYSEWQHSSNENTNTNYETSEIGDEIIDVQRGPYDLQMYMDYDQALAHAKRVNKPVLLLFTGYACVNCRKMEENVWGDSKVLKLLRNNFVLSALHVDHRKELPEKDKKHSEILKDKMETYGDKWNHMQIEKYGTNAQPYYIILDPFTQAKMSNPIAYTSRVSEFFMFLDKSKKLQK